MTHSSEHLDQVFFALSDETRRAILSRLTEGEMTIGALAKPFIISAPAITKHIKILERAGLVERRITGRQHRCTLSTDCLKTAEDWLTFHRQFWESRMDSIEQLLDQEQPESPE